MSLSKLERIKMLVSKMYGFTPKVTKFMGKVYVSDPSRKSEPWEVWDSENEAIQELTKNNYEENYYKMFNNKRD